MHNDKTASRVTVLDAVQLDSEIHNILKEQLGLISKYLPPGLLSRYGAEIDTLLRIIIWKLSVNRCYATFGQQILKLKYDSDATKYKLKILGLLRIGSYYLNEKSSSILLNIRNEHLAVLAQKIFDWSEIACKILNIFAFIQFLRGGNAPTFLERLLGLKPVSTVPPSARSIGYSYVTRELLWHGFVELLVFMIPLINYHSLRRILGRVLPCRTRKDVKKSELDFKIGTKCVVCHQVPVIPHHMGCAHVFCYYCLAANRVADDKFECPCCGYSNPDKSAMRLVQL